MTIKMLASIKRNEFISDFESNNAARHLSKKTKKKNTKQHKISSFKVKNFKIVSIPDSLLINLQFKYIY